MPKTSKMRLVMLITMVMTSIGSVSHAGFYEGNYKEWVDRLLSVTGAWDCPYNAPRVKAEGCELDRQVAAAVKSAFQAECLARDGETDKAAAAAEQMFNLLKAAAGMCHNSTLSHMDEGRKSCDTEKIFDCEAFQP